jgi:hypothetical protein
MPKIAPKVRKSLHQAITDNLTQQDLIEIFDYELRTQLGNVINVNQSFSQVVYDALSWLNRNDAYWPTFLHALCTYHSTQSAFVQIVHQIQRAFQSELMTRHATEYQLLNQLDIRTSTPNSVTGELKPLGATDSPQRIEISHEHDNLEKIVVADPDRFSDPKQWRQIMMQADRAICRIEKPEGKPHGTGFLIGPDLLLTNHHVKDTLYGNFAENPQAVRCRFGFQEFNSETPAPSLYGLAADWLVAESSTNQLDYAIIRLQGQPGCDRRMSSATSQLRPPSRGWIQLTPVSLQSGQTLIILQHPNGDTLKMATGILKATQGPWLQYLVNTDRGSSGSPVFNNRWELVALHSRHGEALINQGIAITAILESLSDSLRAELLAAHPFINTTDG